MKKPQKSMASQVLIDQTMLQAMHRHAFSRERLYMKARELLQLVEHLLLADVVWINNLTTGPSQKLDESLLDIFEKFGLTQGGREGRVRLSQFSTEDHHNALAFAGTELANELLHLTEPRHFRESVSNIHRKYTLRPVIGGAPIRYAEIAGILPNSEEAADLVRKGLETSDWESNIAPFLLNEQLHWWLVEFNERTSGQSDLAYSQLNTIVRWHIYEQLAKRLGSEGNEVQYAPAYGRALCIESHVNGQRGHLERMLRPIIRHRLDSAKWALIESGLNPILESDMPLFGIWLILQLPEKCTINNLLEKIIEMQDHELVTTTRSLLRTAKESQISVLCKEVESRLKLSEKIDLKGEQPASERVKILLKPTPPFVELRGDFNQEIHEYLARARCKLFLREPATVLTGFVDEGLRRLHLENNFIDRVADLIMA